MTAESVRKGPAACLSTDSEKYEDTVAGPNCEKIVRNRIGRLLCANHAGKESAKYGG